MRFGAFELQLANHELRRAGALLKVQAQPLKVLTLLSSRPGQIVTRQEIRKELWGDDTFVDFERSINFCINHLRIALNDDPQRPEYIETVPRHGYRFIAEIIPASTNNGDGEYPSHVSDACESGESHARTLLGGQVYVSAEGDRDFPVVRNNGPPQAVQPEATLNRLNPWSWPGQRKTLLRWALLPLLCLGLVGIAITISLHRKHAAARASSSLSLVRLTFDPGVQLGATFSPDGRFIAYSSDRGGKFDIWIQQEGSANPSKVTTRPGHNWQPDWSPDGRQIVFRSEGEGGGLFVVPAFGGGERKIASFGYRPRWSPDGEQILFDGTFSPWLWNKLYVVGLDGQAPHEVLSEFFQRAHLSERSVEWYPEGKRLSIWSDSDEGLVFWTVSITGTQGVKSTIAPDAIRQLEDISLKGQQFRWAPRGRALYFEGESKGIRNLWKVMVDPKTLRWQSLQRLTTGPGPDTDLALSRDGGKLAFTARAERVRLWSWPFDSRAGSILGDGRAITSPGLDAWMPDISPDGKKLVFVTQRFGKWQLWEASTADGRETLLVDRSDICAEPRWSPDGTRLLYIHRDPDYTVLLPEGGGNEERLTSAGSEAGTDWSPDGQFVVSIRTAGEYGAGNAKSAMLLFPVLAAPHAEAKAQLITSTRNDGIYQMRFSPDGRWIAFELVKGGALPGGGATDATLYVVPAAGGSWVRITDGNSWDDKPRWSPDGKTLYFMSSRTGFLNVWAIRFDGLAGRAVREPFQVTAFDNPSLMMPADRDLALLQISLAEHRLVLPLASVSGNIWLLENVNQ